jgi:cold shock protein
MTTDRESVDNTFVTRGSRPSFASPVAPGAVEKDAATQGTAIQGTAIQGTAIQGTAIQGTGMKGPMKGTVKWFNVDKGWGFIKQEFGPDVFVHYSQIEVGTLAPEERRVLQENETVMYELTEGPKGLLAVNVKRELAD